MNALYDLLLCRVRGVAVESPVIRRRGPQKSNRHCVKNTLLRENRQQVRMVCGNFCDTSVFLFTDHASYTGALVSAGFEVSATVVKTKELDEAYVCREEDKPDFNTGRTTAARYLKIDIRTLVLQLYPKYNPTRTFNN